MGPPETKYTFQCPYCCKLQLVDGFKTVRDVRDHIEQTEDDGPAKDFASSMSPTQDIHKLHNRKKVTVASTALCPRLDSNKIPCQRCRQILKHAHKLINKTPFIYATDILEICDHCRIRIQCRQLCNKCAEIVKNNFAGYSNQKKDTKKYVKDIERGLFKTNSKDKEFDIHSIESSPSKSICKTQVKPMFYSDTKLIGKHKIEKKVHVNKVSRDFQKAVTFTEPLEIFQQTSDSYQDFAQGKISEFYKHYKAEPEEIKMKIEVESKENAIKFKTLTDSYLDEISSSVLASDAIFFFPNVSELEKPKKDALQIDSSEMIKQTQEMLQLKAQKGEIRHKIQLEKREKKKSQIKQKLAAEQYKSQEAETVIVINNKHHSATGVENELYKTKNKNINIFEDKMQASSVDPEGDKAIIADTEGDQAIIADTEGNKALKKAKTIEKAYSQTHSPKKNIQPKIVQQNPSVDKLGKEDRKDHQKVNLNLHQKEGRKLAKQIPQKNTDEDEHVLTKSEKRAPETKPGKLPTNIKETSSKGKEEVLIKQIKEARHKTITEKQTKTEKGKLETEAKKKEVTEIEPKKKNVKKEEPEQDDATDSKLHGKQEKMRESTEKEVKEKVIQENQRKHSADTLLNQLIKFKKEDAVKKQRIGKSTKSELLRKSEELKVNEIKMRKPSTENVLTQIVKVKKSPQTVKQKTSELKLPEVSKKTTTDDDIKLKKNLEATQPTTKSQVIEKNLVKMTEVKLLQPIDNLILDLIKTTGPREKKKEPIQKNDIQETTKKAEFIALRQKIVKEKVPPKDKVGPMSLKIAKPEEIELKTTQVKLLKPSVDDLILKLIKMKQNATSARRDRRRSKDLLLTSIQKAFHSDMKHTKYISNDSESDYEKCSEPFHAFFFEDIIIGRSIKKYVPPFIPLQAQETKPPLFVELAFSDISSLDPLKKIEDVIKDTEVKPKAS